MPNAFQSSDPSNPSLSRDLHPFRCAQDMSLSHISTSSDTV